jgi:hypothetical protein
VIELREVGADDFEDVYPVLLGFHNRRMSREDWRRMLFAYPWADEPRRGYALYAGARAVGFLGTISSVRRRGGRVERFCNFSAWIVDPEHRSSSIMLTRPVVSQMEGYTILGLTPAPVTCAVFGRLGFETYETEQLMLLPLPSPREALAALSGSVVVAPEELERELRGEELAIHRDHAGSRAVGALIRRGGRQCYLVARADRRKHLRVAELLYVGDRELFWQNRFLAQAAFLRALGAVALVVDGRLAEGRRVPRALRLPKTRIVRPGRPGVDRMELDALYSELVMLRE